MTASEGVPEQHPALVRLARDVTLADGARSGGVWLAVSSFGTQGFQFVISIVMARLLLPRQFGETALVNAIAGFALIFTDLGLTSAVVQARRVTDELLSSAFWLSAISGVGMTVLVCALAVPISDLYGQPQLVGLFLVVSLNFTFSVGAVHLALLERSFHFRRIAIIETISSIVGFCVMPAAVELGLGVYSIVLGPVVTTALLTVLLWSAARWRPRPIIRRPAIAELWAFSRGLVGYNSLNYWNRNLDNALLGTTVSSATLGDYNRAYNLMLIPVGQIGTVLMRSVYPALARMRDEPARVGRAWSRAVAAASGAFATPLALTMAATAPALVAVLYGPRWAGMVPMLQLLALAAVPQILGASTGAPYRAAGRTGLLFKLGLIGTTLTLIAIVAGLRWGATGVAAAILIKSWINMPIVVAPLARMLGIPLREVLQPAVAGWVPSVAAAVGELAIRFLLPSHSSAWLVLALQLLVGASIFAGILWRSQSDVAVEVKALARRLRP